MKKNNKPFYTRFSSTFFEKTRLSILTIIHQEGIVSFNRLKKILNITDGALYSHVLKLINEGYLSSKKVIKKNVPQTLYKMTKKGKNTYIEYLKFLEQHLENIKKEE